MSFRLVPINSVTLDDSERRNSPKRNVISPNSVAFGTDYITFYLEEEIVAAKNVLKGFAESLAASTSRYGSRRPGDNKRKLDFEDIVNLWAQLDAAKVTFPLYAAVNLTRIPTVKPTEADICMLAANMSTLKQEVQELSSLKSSVVALNELIQGQLSQQPELTNEPVSVEQGQTDDYSGPHATTQSTSSFARVAATAAADDGYTLVSRHKPRNSTSKTANKSSSMKIIKGSSSNHGVSGVPRRLVAFVSRLHTDTTENDLQLMLENAGVTDVKCFRIKPKDGKTYKTAAFRVSCDPQSAAVFYDETTWPCGCELRDWVFYQR